MSRAVEQPGRASNRPSRAVAGMVARPMRPVPIGDDMHDIGEKPGTGHYCCTNCGWRVRLDDASDRLPPCGSCGRGQNTKYNRC